MSGSGTGGDSPLRRALAGLVRAAEPPAGAVVQFVERVGAVDAWAAVRDRSAPAAVRAATRARLADLDPSALDARADADLDTGAAVGARIVGAGDAEWPTAAFVAFPLAAARGVSGAAAPVGLWLRGLPLTGVPDRAVTMVGSRACTGYGRRVAGEISAAVAAAGAVVVSGAAFGVDTAAHQAALLGGGRTVAVLACGIDRAYPAANARLLEEIAAAGTVVSEYPPGGVPARHRFLVRNRLIAALAAGTVVVEAGRRSGTLSTAAAAGQLGRLVMAVPGPVTSALSVGCHLLLADRFAQLVTDGAGVLTAIGIAAADPVPPIGVGRDPRHPTDGLDPEVARVHEALPARRSVPAADLVVESALPGATVVAALAVLELAGLAERDGPLWRRADRHAR
ncbi:DNA-processing protein DprA [Nakamurella leprariae]|uniref:DNA-protecting protein DprA n=1 Tax=Nakamurella leprariae TaxID=2803911 RepID=A0A938YC39_9ACTN|nr:DNA-processing protein DprA [Nakamurella leprariae]MBM9466866.1 DNA-protecting protein DprA [Nakamurella leprariae]